QPSLGLLAVNALTASHGVIIPLETEFFALRGVALLIETIEKVQDRLNPSLEIDGILATMFDSRTLHSKEVMARVTEAFGEKVFESVINRTVKFPDASVAAEPITSFAPKHAGSEDYRRLAPELTARRGAPCTTPQSRQVRRSHLPAKRPRRGSRWSWRTSPAPSTCCWACSRSDGSTAPRSHWPTSPLSSTPTPPNSRTRRTSPRPRSASSSRPPCPTSKPPGWRR